ncbi:hypothetical protein POM88_051861 [Heracleum sosnowskyi]|uniref:Cucumisin n=1 Tax=Heracleum sosnowskyi TaxID=360622 RepID=A0AAD8GRZ8_9APIA|nr:hypothetical protein POM88_051861 [Heracleum sosnowskyi]
MGNFAPRSPLKQRFNHTGIYRGYSTSATFAGEKVYRNTNLDKSKLSPPERAMYLPSSSKGKISDYPKQKADKFMKVKGSSSQPAFDAELKSSDGGKLEDAKAVCEPQKQLNTYLAPSLHGKPLHFTEVSKLELVSNCYLISYFHSIDETVHCALRMLWIDDDYNNLFSKRSTAVQTILGSKDDMKYVQIYSRFAVYKVCWSDGCSDADILTAFDEAIADGVDIISISVGGAATDYFEDSIAIGSFHAMKNWILTFASPSAGNTGLELGKVTNVSPWILTVAASTHDRKFLTKLQLGNGLNYEGVSVNTFTSKNLILYILGYVINEEISSQNLILTQKTQKCCEKCRYCRKSSLDSNLVKGKIVLCDELSNGESDFLSGAAGTIMRDAENRDNTKPFPLPATFLNGDDVNKALKYIRSTRNPTATILKSVEAIERRTTYVASFSSRGITPEILKPNITAPGVGILAAWSPAAPLSGISGDNRRVLYNIKSGTSMSCPHATAIAAYIKSFFPAWSPAAIKSALMTTAFPLNSTTSPDGEFAYGAGHIDPIKALNPGLVYDADETPASLKIRVEPSVLSFTSLVQKLTFRVQIAGELDRAKVSASFVWDDGKHKVRSPIVVYDSST